MPLTVSKMAADTASVTLQYGDDSVTIVYYPSRITEKVIAQVMQLQNMDSGNTQDVLNGFSSINEMLATLIKSWDVYEDDAQTIMYPLVPDRLAALPLMFRIQVFQAVGSDIRPEALVPQTQS